MELAKEWFMKAVEIGDKVKMRTMAFAGDTLHAEGEVSGCAASAITILSCSHND